MRRLAVLPAVVCALAAPSAAHAAQGDVLVRFAPGADAAERADARADAGVRHGGRLAVRGAELVQPAAGVSVAQAVAALEAEPGVLYAEPDVPRTVTVTPDDALFGQQWALRNTGQTVDGRPGTPGADVAATRAWDVTTGASDVVVAIIDSGADVAHPDLAPNVRVNPGEVAGNRRDDDENGLVDDVRGWDFVEDDGVTNDPTGHGTHVAGIAAARGGDGAGVAGVAWGASLLPLRAVSSTGVGMVSDVVAAIAYAERAGARVVNLSFGGLAASNMERDAIAAAPGMLFVAAAGNDGVDVDSVPRYPCAYDLSNVVCVAASDPDDGLAPFSNRGRATVDLAAPGVSVLSTGLGGTWRTASGTSMAAPHVSGAAALLASRSPEGGPGALRAALLDSVARRPAFEERTASRGRLDVGAALGALGGDDDRAVAAPAPPAPAAPAPVFVSLPSRSAPNADRLGPELGLSLRTRRLSRLRRGLVLRVRCSEACRLGAEARRGARRIAEAQGRLIEAGTVDLRLRPSRADLRRLRRARSARLTIRVTAVDAAGNDRTEALAVVLRRR